MAITAYSTEVTAKNASAGEKYNNLHGLKVAEFTYTTSGLETAGSVIELVELPVTAQVIGVAMEWEDCGTCTGDLGTTSGGQEISAGLVLGTADVNFVDWTAPVTASLGKVWLEILGATADASKAINGVIFYF